MERYKGVTQTLTTLGKQWVLEQATTVGNNYYLSQNKSQQKERKIPVGDHAVPWSNPDWNP
jgi:hypothetical protein